MERQFRRRRLTVRCGGFLRCSFRLSTCEVLTSSRRWAAAVVADDAPRTPQPARPHQQRWAELEAAAVQGRHFPDGGQPRKQLPGCWSWQPHRSGLQRRSFSLRCQWRGRLRVEFIGGRSRHARLRCGLRVDGSWPHGHGVADAPGTGLPETDQETQYHRRGGIRARLRPVPWRWFQQQQRRSSGFFQCSSSVGQRRCGCSRSCWGGRFYGVGGGEEQRCGLA